MLVTATDLFLQLGNVAVAFFWLLNKCWPCLCFTLSHSISLYTGQKFAGCRCNGGCGVCGHIERCCLQTVQRGKWCCCCRSKEVWRSQVGEEDTMLMIFSQYILRLIMMMKKKKNYKNNEIMPGVNWRETSLPSLSLLSSPRTACPWLACSLFSTASFQFLKPM